MTWNNDTIAQYVTDLNRERDEGVTQGPELTAAESTYDFLTYPLVPVDSAEQPLIPRPNSPADSPASRHTHRWTSAGTAAAGLVMIVDFYLGWMAHTLFG